MLQACHRCELVPLRDERKAGSAAVKTTDILQLKSNFCGSTKRLEHLQQQRTSSRPQLIVKAAGQQITVQAPASDLSCAPVLRLVLSACLPGADLAKAFPTSFLKV